MTPEILWNPELCSCCRKEQLNRDPFGVFIIIIVRGEAMGEPIIRDGIFDSKGKVAFLKACPTCLPKVDSFHKHQGEEKAPDRLPDGPIKTLCRELWRRKNGQLVISPSIFDKLYLKQMGKETLH